MVLTSRDRLLEQMNQSDFSSFGGYYRLSFPSLGTVNEITYSTSSTARARDFRAAVFEWLGEFESRYSVFIEDSLISEINRQAGKAVVNIDAMTEELLSLCHWYHWKTRGLFDATTGPLITLWDYHRKHDALPSAMNIVEARERVGWDKVERTAGQVRLSQEGMRLDLGGIGKEYAVDCLVRLAGEFGIPNILVSLGRDVKGLGGPPEGGGWRVGLERPDDPARCWAGVYLEDMSVCCSGHYARCFTLNGVRYSHLINPRTGYPSAAQCEAVWVLSPSCVEAGILSTTAALLDFREAFSLIESDFNACGCYWTRGARYETGKFKLYVIKETN